MIYLLLLLLLWKPVYFSVKYFTLRGKDTEVANKYVEKIKVWFSHLWSLISPGDLK